MARELFDTNIAMYVLGYLMDNPQELNKDTCLLTLNDFPKPSYQAIFGAIFNMASQGVSKIYAQDIDLYLAQYGEQYRIFSENGGIEFCKQLEALTTDDNAQFMMYYNKLKKFTVLRDLEKCNIDTTEFYDPSDVFKKEDEEKKLDNISIPQILDRIRLKLANIEKINFNKDGNYFQTADQGIDQLIDSLQNDPDIGYPIEGEMLNYICRGGRQGKMYLYSAGSGGGKALPNSTKIPMANGSWKTVGEVQVGDYLIDRHGKPTRVNAIFPQGLKDVYEVVFKDGRKALCNDEHLWTVHNVDAKQYGKLETITLRQLIEVVNNKGLKTSNNAWRYSVPVNESVEYPEENYKLPPYLMGLLLGDGSFRKQPCNYELQFSEEEEKYIPEIYLRGSIEQRFELLNGLLDTDGSVDEKSRVSFSSISKKLVDGLVRLCRSLGLVPTVNVDKCSYKYTTGICYKVVISGRPELKRKLFKMERKHALIENWFNNGKRKENYNYNPIIEINKLNYQEEMTCFLVDNNEHLFLMNDYIVTHNTRFFMQQACYRSLPRLRDGKLIMPAELQKVYFISVEQEPEELQTMILAYISGVEEHKMHWKTWTDEELKRIKQAGEILKQYGNNLYIDRIPEPSIAKVRSTIIEKILDKNIDMVVYDYIAIPEDDEGTATKRQLRSDQVLMQFSNMLKEVAVSYNVFMLTGTQITGSDPKSKLVRGFADIRDGKSIADKADFCMIGCEVTDEEYSHIETYCKEMGIGRPNYVIDIYKNRSGVHKGCKVYRDTNLGNLTSKDLLVTTQSFKLINDVGAINYGSQRIIDVVDFLTRGDNKC